MPGFKLSRPALQDALSPGCSEIASDWVGFNGGELVPGGTWYPQICGHFVRGKAENMMIQGIWQIWGLLHPTFRQT